MISGQEDGGICPTVLAFCLLGFLVFTASAAPSGTETRISYSTGPYCYNIHPSADNGWVVWEEVCPDSNNLIAYNYRSGVQLNLPNSTLSPHSPNIRGNRVIWFEGSAGGSTSLYYTDLTTASPTAHRLNLPPSVKTNPVVDGNIVVWEDKESIYSPTSDILMYNISSSTQYNLTPDTPDSHQVYPSVSGNRVVWLDTRNGQRDIFMNTTYAGWAAVNITPGIPGTGQNRPVINGDRIIWFDDTYTIYLHDLTTTTLLPSYSSGDPVSTVAVCSTYYVWGEDTGGIVDIFINNTFLSQPPERITDSGSNPYGGGVLFDPDNAPVIITPDSRIIWVDDRTGYSEIFMFTYGTPATCPVVRISASPTEGPAPLLVAFTDLSPDPFTFWRWEFGDGSIADSRNTSHQYPTNGIFTARLVAGTPYCRNASDGQTISVGIPAVDFTGAPVEGIAPHTVAFRGSATGSPATWLWDFGDGGVSPLRNPTHVYSTGGIYNVSLTATNSFGSGVRTKPAYINVRNGLQEYAFTNISGISVSGSGSSQYLIVDKTRIPVYSLRADRRILTVFPDAGYGWQSITFASADAAGFSDSPGTITGRIAATTLRIRDLQPTAFSSGIGSNLKMNYTMEIGQYSAPGYLLSRLWEGTLPSDDGWFFEIIHKSGFTNADIGYTLNITRNNLSHPSWLNLKLSAGSDWVTGSTDIETGRDQTRVIAMGYNETGALLGMVLPARFTGNDTAHGIEYFETDIPTDTLYFSTFALAQLSGTGNPFQLITLTVTSHVPPEPPVSEPADSDDSSRDSGAGGGYGTVPVIVTAATPAPAPTIAPPDPGRSAKIYTNAGGVVTQAIRLPSTDGRAVISLGEGVVARDAGGRPLAEITLKALPSADLPGVPPGSAFTFAGMAYEIGPDGARFLPPLTLTFTLPQAQWGKDYIIRSFDRKTGTWQDLPTTFDAAKGTITAEVTDLCVFALFNKPREAPVTTPAKTPLPVPSAPLVKAQPPTTAVSIFTNMLTWVAELVMNNAIILVVVVILAAIAVYMIRQRRFPGSGR